MTDEKGEFKGGESLVEEFCTFLEASQRPANRHTHFHTDGIREN